MSYVEQEINAALSGTIAAILGSSLSEYDRFSSLDSRQHQTRAELSDLSGKATEVHWNERPLALETLAETAAEFERKSFVSVVSESAARAAECVHLTAKALKDFCKRSYNTEGALAVKTDPTTIALSRSAIFGRLVRDKLKLEQCTAGGRASVAAEDLRTALEGLSDYVNRDNAAASLAGSDILGCVSLLIDVQRSLRFLANEPDTSTLPTDTRDQRDLASCYESIRHATAKAIAALIAEGVAGMLHDSNFFPVGADGHQDVEDASN